MAADTTVQGLGEVSVGVPEMDADHRILIGLIERLGAPRDLAELPALLTDLDEFCAYHFAREERMLEVTGYPQLAAHRAHHDVLRERLADDLRRHAEALEAGEGAGGDLPKLRAYLKRWLLDHLLLHDLTYASRCADNSLARVAAASVAEEADAVPDGDAKTAAV